MAREKLPLSKFFCLVLERRRRAKMVSRQALAEQAGLHQTAVGLIERGLRTPNLDTAHLLAEALKTDLAAMIGEAEKLRGIALKNPMGTTKKAASEEQKTVKGKNSKKPLA